MLSTWLRASAGAGSVPATPTDPNFSSVTALLHGQGTNNATSPIIDSSPLAANWTANGSAKISTAQYKWGSSSLTFGSGSTGYFSPTASASNFAWGTGAFTIEAWIRINDATAPFIWWEQRTAADPNGPLIAWFVYQGTLRWWFNGDFRINGSTTFASNTWYHVAVSRSGTSTKMFINGTQDGSTLTDSTNYGGGEPRIGADFTGYCAPGYVQDLRTTKGVARYTSNFTAPTATFPDA